jgi:hypothetical protein
MTRLSVRAREPYWLGATVLFGILIGEIVRHATLPGDEQSPFGRKVFGLYTLLRHGDIIALGCVAGSIVAIIAGAIILARLWERSGQVG